MEGTSFMVNGLLCQQAPAPAAAALQPSTKKEAGNTWFPVLLLQGHGMSAEGSCIDIERPLCQVGFVAPFRHGLSHRVLHMQLRRSLLPRRIVSGKQKGSVMAMIFCGCQCLYGVVDDHYDDVC